MNDYWLGLATEPIVTYSVTVSNIDDDDEIIMEIIKSHFDLLRHQVLISTPHRISLEALIHTKLGVPKDFLFWTRPLRLNLDIFYYLYYRFKKTPPFGGFILYDYAVGAYTLEQYSEYVNILKKLYRVELS